MRRPGARTTQRSTGLLPSYPVTKLHCRYDAVETTGSAVDKLINLANPGYADLTATGTNRPTVGMDGGVDALRFARASDQFASVTGLSPSIYETGQFVVWFQICRMVSLPSQEFLVCATTTAGPNYKNGIRWQTNTMGAFQSTDAGTLVSEAAFVDTDDYWLFKNQLSAAGITVGINGADTFVADANTGLSDPGQEVYLGIRPDLAVPADMWWRETALLVDPSPAEVAQAANYFLSRVP